MQTFRITRVEHVSAIKDSFDAIMPLSQVQITMPRTGSDDSWISVITGRNGRGKSRAFRAIVALMLGCRGGRLREKNLGGQWEVEFESSGDAYVLRNGPTGKIKAYKNGDQWNPADIPLPTRVIALSVSVNDKFPIPPAGSDDLHFYHYMGVRDRTGRASGTAPLLATLEALALVNAEGGERRQRISALFASLGYKSQVSQTYRWRYLAALDGEMSFSQLVAENRLGPQAASRISGATKRDPRMLERLEWAVPYGRSRSAFRPEWVISSDFGIEGAGQQEEDLEAVRVLKRAGLLRLTSVELIRTSGHLTVDLREASSGEISLASNFLGIAASIQDGALILVDEPEISLHPEWQASYLGQLRSMFGDYRGCHFVIATHSPSLVSGIPSGNTNVVSLDDSATAQTDGSEYSGDSVDELLVREFKVLDPSNLFLQKCVVEALDLVSKGEIASEEFRRVLLPIEELAESASEGAASVAGLVRTLLDAHHRIRAEGDRVS